jgi:hypothetical protein
MPFRALLAMSVTLLGVLAPVGSAAEGTTARAASCVQDGGLRLHGDGTVYACRMSRETALSISPEAKEREVVCSADSYVEFHHNGHLSYCDHLAKPAAYLTRGGESRNCKSKGPIAFNESGHLEYCG